jgi:hypothetical protein
LSSNDVLFVKLGHDPDELFRHGKVVFEDGTTSLERDHIKLFTVEKDPSENVNDFEKRFPLD